VALVTDEFWAQGDFVAGAAGMPDIPRQRLPHPVAGSGTEAMADVADRIADEVIARLRGQSTPEPTGAAA
jgi:hypothetical protein